MPSRIPAEDQPRTSLDQRVPGETDLTVFTTAVQRAGRHRPDPSRLRVVRDGPDGRPLLRALASPEGRRAAARMAAASSRGGCAHRTGTERPMIVLLGRPARDRLPTATCWRLIEYDSTTRLPVGDVAARWEPAGSCPPARVNRWITEWASSVLGHPVRADELAADLAGPGAWLVLPDATERGERP